LTFLLRENNLAGMDLARLPCKINKESLRFNIQIKEGMLTIQDIQSILSLQKGIGKPNPQICANIASLKDLCDLNATNVEWRRGTQGGSAAIRPVYRNGSSSSLSQNGSPFPRNTSAKSLTTPPESPAPYTPVAKTNGPYVSVRYQSQFKNSLKPMDDKILHNIILSKLNKFSVTTYGDIREFLYQILGSGEEGLVDMVRQFMLMVFKKAASEEIYCSLYAKLLSEISARYGVILEEMHKLQENYLMIFDDVEEKEDSEKYETFVEKNIEKRYRQGYSQFIAELSTFEIIKLSHLEQTFRHIFDLMLKNAVLPDKKTLLEEYADCLVRMSRVFKKKSSPFFIAARASLLALSKQSLNLIIEKNDIYQSVSPKTRFILMDVKDNLTA